VSEPETDLRDYDPALAETVREGKGDDEVSVIARVTDVAALPPWVVVVTRFGEIVTLRAPRSRIAELAQSKAVLAMEASQRLRPTWGDCQQSETTEGLGDGNGCFLPVAAEDDAYTRRPEGVRATGRGVVVGVLDWGCDFAHPAFRNEDGSTRLLALWDQRGSGGTSPGNRWGYGRILTAAEIDRALGEEDPYDALGYHPADSDPPEASGGPGAGAHGTHVLDIAAGNGGGGGAIGVAPEADLLFCHLSSTVDVLSRGNLGDAGNLLEALDWIFETAGDRPCVVNLSLGAHGGPHDGCTLVEEGIDKALWLKSGRAAVNSAGNYFEAGAHTQGRLHQDGQAVLRVSVPSGDPTESEIELWYSGADRFTVTVSGPDGEDLATVGPGADAPMTVDGRVVGHVYHVRQATNQEHQVDVFLRPRAPGGTWTITVRGDVVEDGRYHAWIERDRGPHPHFEGSVAVGTSTTGTLCNGRLSIAVGAYDPHARERRIGSFSSAGPTRDGRVKPEIVGPGVDICAARSTPAGKAPRARYVSKSGTSMAAPHVTGAIAVMFEAARRPLEIDEIRALLFASAQRVTIEDGAQVAVDLHRFGYGYLDIPAMERAARDWAGGDAAEERIEELSEVLVEAQPGSPPEGAVPATEGETMDDVLTEAEPADAAMEPSVAMEPISAAMEPVGEAMDDSTFAWPDDEPPSPASFRQVLWSLAESAPAWPGPDELVDLAASALGIDSDPRLFVLAHPATRLEEDVRPGDLLVRSAPAQGLHYTSIVVSDPVERGDLTLRRVPVEAGGPGLYVEVAEAPLPRGALRSVGRRLTDAWGRVPRGQTLFRADEAAPFMEWAEDDPPPPPPEPSFDQWVPEQDSIVLLAADQKLFILPSSRMGVIAPPERLRNIDWRKVVLAHELGPLLGLPPVGAGGSRIVKAGPRYGVMMDVGRNPQRQPAIWYLDHVAARMHDLEVSELRTVILIHRHSDHVNEIARVVREFNIPAANVIMPEAYVGQQPRKQWDALLAALRQQFGASWQPTTLKLKPQSPSRELLRGRYLLGDTTFEFFALGSALRLQQHTDRASLLTRIQRRGEGGATAVIGDLRGADLEAFHSVMGAPRFNEFFRDITTIDGFSHHRGALVTGDVNGLMRLLDATLLKTGRLTVVLQTDPGQHQMQRADTLELMRHIGIEVREAHVAESGQASGVRATVRGARASGPYAQAHQPHPSVLVEGLARIAKLHQARATVDLWGPHIAQSNSSFNLTTELRQIDTSLAELRRTVKEAVKAAFDVRVNGSYTSAGARDYANGASGRAFVAALGRIPATTAAETAIGPAGFEGLARMRRIPPADVPRFVALRDALTNAKYSPQAFQYMLAQLDPATRDSLLKGPRGGPRSGPAAFRRVKAEFGFRLQNPLSFDVMRSAHLRGAPRAVARGAGAALMVVELGNLVAQGVQSYRVSQATARKRNILPFLRRIAFWRQLRAEPAVVAVDDGLTGATFERGSAAIDTGLQKDDWDFLFIEHTATRPALSDAEILQLIAVLGFNVRSYDEWNTLFDDSGQDAVRIGPSGSGDTRWEVRVGRFDTSGTNHIEERWVELPLLSEGLRAVFNRAVKNTVTLLERAARNESTDTEDYGVLQLPPGKLLYQAQLRPGIGASVVELRPSVPSTFSGSGPAASRVLKRSVKWSAGDRPRFFVWAETATHVLVSGADFMTYASLRDLLTESYSVGSSGTTVNQLLTRVVGNETGEGWLPRYEIVRI